MSHLPSRAACGAAVVATLVALLLYVVTAATDIALVDSGELALAAYTGGVAHPPGFPLYLLLGGLFSHLPIFDSPVRALNLMSALFAALSVGMCLLIAERSIAIWELSRGSAGTGVRGVRSGPLLAASAAAVAWATARNPWSWSGIAEVYSLNIFLVSAAWVCGLVWACGEYAELARRSRRSRAGATTSRGWLLAALVFAGLGLANHSATSALIFPALLLMLLAINPAMLRHRSFLAEGTAVLIACLGLYSYLLIAARSDPGLGWGGIDSLSELIRHVAGWQYRAQVSSDAALTGMVLRGFGASLLLDSGLLCSALAVLGLGVALNLRTTSAQRKTKEVGPHDRGRKARKEVRAAKEKRKHEEKYAGPSPTPAYVILLGVPLLLISLNLVLVVTYTAGPEDRQSYELPAHLAWCVLAGLGLWLLGERWPGLRRPLFALPLILALAGLNLLRNFTYCDLSSEHSARTFVRETLDEVPAGSIVFTTEWNLYAPYLYMRHVEGYRPEVSVVDVSMMRRAWYAAYLERSIPKYVEAARPEFDAFREQVTRFDQGRPYDNARIAKSYAALIARWVEVGRERAAAWVDFGGLGLAQERDWIAGQKPIPDGLLIRLEEVGRRGAQERPMRPKDTANLRYLQARVGGDQGLRHPLEMDPTSVRYFRVYDSYRKAVEASLLSVALTQSRAKMNEWAAEYGAWFPDMSFVTASLREKLGKAAAPKRPPAGDPLLERALRQLRESQERGRQQ